MSGWRLIADAGGTNLRFARSLRAGHLSDVSIWPAARFSSFYEALEAYLGEVAEPGTCRSAAIAAAGPADDGTIAMTNLAWSIRAAEISQRLDGAPVALCNDVEAVAAALPHLGEEDVAAIGPLGFGGRRTRRAMLAVNIGTGFGSALVLPTPQGWVTRAGEAGHMRLGAVAPAELDLLGPAATVEELLSGSGVVRLYRRIGATAGAGAAAQAGDAAAVWSRVGSEAAARAALEAFTRILARIAGDLALAGGAWGGVYLCGSVARGWHPLADAALFRRHFEDKGPMSGRMEGVFTGFIERHMTALFGLTWAPPPALPGGPGSREG